MIETNEMTPRQTAILAAVEETGSQSAAARKLGITRAAVSRALATDYRQRCPCGRYNATYARSKNHTCAADATQAPHTQNHKK